MLCHTQRISSWVRGAVVLLALAAVLTPGRIVAQESLYDRLGGVYSIAAVADDILERVLANETIAANPAVKEAHARLSKAGLKFQVASLVCEVTGGPCTYVGRDMKTAHAHLNISEVEWDALMEVFQASFDTFEIPEQEQAELFAIIAGTKADIVVDWDLVLREADDNQWVLPGKNYAATRYSSLDQITVDNIGSLRQVWSFSTGALRGHEGQPLVVDSTMYVHSAYPNHVYALDLTAEGWPIKWRYTPVQDDRAVPVACCDLVHRGVNYAQGKILMTTLDGQVIALDAESGQELWKAKNADPLRGETMTMSGLVVKNKFIVGVSGGEFGIRGWVAAYDLDSGQQMWKAYSMGPDEDVMLAPDFNAANPHHGRFGEGTRTWPGERWRNGGGSTWGWYAYDPDLDLLYYSTGNPGTWNPTPREGDNKWSMSIFARDPDTGMAKWAYQMTPWDAWDYDGINEHVLLDLTIDGTAVQALVHFDRNGFAYVLDRTNGTLLSADKFVESTNWAERIDLETGRPVEDPSKRTRQGVNTMNICPAAMGAKNQQPVSYSPRTHLIYAGTNNLCMNYEGVEVRYIAGAPYVGANVRIFAGPGGYQGEFMAWDPEAGRKVWGITEPFPVWTGTVVTAGDVVFYGTMDGWFKAVNARSGVPLWKAKLPSGSIGNPMTFMGPDNKQYVAIYSGIGGWFGLPIAGNLSREDPLGALGAVGAAFDSGLDKVTSVGGTLHVFALE